MKCARAVVGAVVRALAVSQASAQVRVVGFQGGRGIGWGYGWSGRSLAFSGIYGGFSGFGYGPSFGYSSVTIIQPYVPRSTVIIDVPRESLTRDRDRDEPPPDGIIRIRPRREREPERDRDKERVREQEPEKIKAPNPFEPRAQPELIPPPQLLEQPRVKPPEPARPRPMEDPREASARHIALGKEAFAIGEYARAAFRFQKAAELAPDQALPHFLLAQSLLALGKYRDAVAAIHAGMALDPTWPAT